MRFFIVGLGNPGEEYKETRHNIGRNAVFFAAKIFSFENFAENKKAAAHIAEGKIGKALVAAIVPDTYMNKSGNAVSRFVKSKKAAENLVVLHDELDLPLGKIKISFGRGSGGHKGLESIMRALKTKDFVRVRIGISPSTPSGKLRKPQGEKEVIDFILGKFKKAEQEELRATFKKVSAAVETILTEGRAAAMNAFN